MRQRFPAIDRNIRKTMFSLLYGTERSYPSSVGVQHVWVQIQPIQFYVLIFDKMLLLIHMKAKHICVVIKKDIYIYF